MSDKTSAVALWDSIKDLTDYDETIDVIAALLASRALEEAKWWAKNGTHGHVTDEAVERIAALEQAAASKAAGGGQ